MTFSAPAERDPLGAALTSVIRWAAEEAPRNRQVAIGPSEMGDVCVRRLAYKTLGYTGTNTNMDPLPSIIGVATHAWLAEAFRADNARYAVPRWLVETKVYPDDSHSGSCDLYDASTGTVIDWKCPGVTAMKKHRLVGPSQRYVVQLHLYGLGFRRLGLRVNTVALALLPRAGMLSGLTTWSAPYDEAVALWALNRMAEISMLTYDLDVEKNPSRWSMVPATPDVISCTYCPMHRPGKAVDESGCPGVEASLAA